MQDEARTAGSHLSNTPNTRVTQSPAYNKHLISISALLNKQLKEHD